jgi:hypothetical protein
MLFDPLILTSSSSASLRFFVYPGPKGSEEPSPRFIGASSAQPKSIYCRKAAWGKSIDFQAI